MERPFSATAVSRCGLSSVGFTISTCGSDLRRGTAQIHVQNASAAARETFDANIVSRTHGGRRAG